jgi:hypothetical protein
MNMKWVDYYGGIRRVEVKADGISYSGLGTCGAPWPKDQMWDTAKEAVEGIQKRILSCIAEGETNLRFLMREVEKLRDQIAQQEKRFRQLDDVPAMENEGNSFQTLLNWR